MLDLEPGVSEGHDNLARFNVELEQSIAQNLGKLVATLTLLCRGVRRSEPSPALIFSQFSHL